MLAPGLLRGIGFLEILILLVVLLVFLGEGDECDALAALGPAMKLEDMVEAYGSG